MNPHGQHKDKRTLSIIPQDPRASASSWEAREPSGGLAGLIRDAVSDVGQGWGQSTGTLIASQGCVWHQALTLTCGFDAACPFGTGITPGPRGLSWEQVPHHGQDGAGCSRIMAASTTLPAAGRAGTDIPAAVSQLPAWAYPHPPKEFILLIWWGFVTAGSRADVQL